MKPLALAALLAALAPAAASAGPAADPASAGACFRMSQIHNHRIAAADTIYIRVGAKEVWRVTTGGACASGAMRDDTLILSTPGGIDMICRPLDLDLKVRSGVGMVSPCIVKSIERLTPEAVAEIPEKLLP